MRLLIAAATEFELTPLLNFLEDYSVREQDIIYKIGPVKVHICITGIGCLATCYNLTKQIKQKSFDLVLQAGIAGAFSESIRLNQVFRVHRDRQVDLGAEHDATYHDALQLGWKTFAQPPFLKDGWLPDWADPIEGMEHLSQAKAISVNTVTGNASSRNRWESLYHPDLESMEGAAFHYICLQESQPFAQIRSVSNYVGERDKKLWDLKGAIETLNQFLIQFVTTRSQLP